MTSAASRSKAPIYIDSSVIRLEEYLSAHREKSDLLKSYPDVVRVTQSYHFCDLNHH